MANKIAAINASTMPTIFVVWGTDPKRINAMIDVIKGAPALVNGETTIALP